jgi:mannan endo-1,4-beta-mannosidase
MPTDPQLIDVHATTQTVALFRNLKKLSGNRILFGHQHATEYGRGWVGDPDRSDVKSVVGTHPAVIGVDLQGLSGRTKEEILKTREALRENIVATYDRGGLTTVSWHMSNPVSGGDFYWKNSPVPAVSQIIPGGSHHEQYQEILTEVANLAHSVTGKDGTLAPMIFRPYHEFDGDWFWWGKPHCSKEEFIILWRFTVSYLRDTLGVHNFIYAFSPDCLFETEGEYLDRYPGDAWVDLLGMDDYADFGRDGTYHLEAGVRKLRIISNYALQANKLAAFTETGLESVAVPNWWTDTLLAVLKLENVKLCYVLVWRNDSVSPTHYYAPHPGHASVPDFITFSQDPLIVFERDLTPLYTRQDIC